eukprot:scaffold66583_cov64-Phaeocystis_antarctica.AAC.8
MLMRAHRAASRACDLGRCLGAYCWHGRVEALGRLWAATLQYCCTGADRSLYWQASPGLCTRTYVLLTTYGTTYLLTYLLTCLLYAAPGGAQQAKQVDTWVEQYKSHANFKYIFRENGRDVLNKQNPESWLLLMKTRPSGVNGGHNRF